MLNSVNTKCLIMMKENYYYFQAMDKCASSSLGAEEAGRGEFMSIWKVFFIFMSHMGKIVVSNLVIWVCR
jgi:hypothetical protein